MAPRFSESLMEHFMEPNNRGSMAFPDGTGVVGIPGAGPFFVFQVSVQNGRVEDAQFQSHTCGVTVASGSALTELVIGRTAVECEQIEADDIITELDGVPVDKRHVPETAITAMRAALEEAGA